jgi:hypothetical protein
MFNSVLVFASRFYHRFMMNMNAAGFVFLLVYSLLGSIGLSADPFSGASPGTSLQTASLRLLANSDSKADFDFDSNTNSGSGASSSSDSDSGSSSNSGSRPNSNPNPNPNSNSNSNSNSSSETESGSEQRAELESESDSDSEFFLISLSPVFVPAALDYVDSHAKLATLFIVSPLDKPPRV